MQVYNSLYNCRAKLRSISRLRRSLRATNNNLGGFPPSGRNINTQKLYKAKLDAYCVKAQIYHTFAISNRSVIIQKFLILLYLYSTVIRTSSTRLRTPQILGLMSIFLAIFLPFLSKWITAHPPLCLLVTPCLKRRSRASSVM